MTWTTTNYNDPSVQIDNLASAAVRLAEVGYGKEAAALVDAISRIREACWPEPDLLELTDDDDDEAGR